MLELFQITQSPVPVLAATRRLTGFVPGTVLRTSDGDIPVEFIAAGDRVLTRERGLVTVQGVSVIEAAQIDLVRFKAGVYDNTRDLVVPAAQQVLVRDWRAALLGDGERMLTSAGALVDGMLVTRETRVGQRLVKLHLGGQGVVWAEGMETANGLIKRTPAKPRATRRLH